MPTDMEIDSMMDMDDIKKCIIDAGLYEENMNYEEMRTYYDAIISSESAFEKDTHNRSEIIISSDFEKDTPEEVLQVDDVMQLLQDSKELDDSIVKDDLVNFDPFDCSPIKHKPLDVIYHKPKYSLAPHVNPALSKIPIEEKKRIVLAFHKKLLQNFYDAHKTSKIHAPLGRPIQSSERFNGTLDRKTPMSSYDFTEESPSDATYVLRSGRQTKRKVYVDAYDSDNEKKKSKKEEEKEKEEYRPSVSKRQASAPKNNQEIMKRSRFFTESPRSSRSDKIFDQLALSEKKRQKDAEMAEKFDASLAKLSDDEDFVPSSQPAVPVNDDVLIIEDAKTQEPPFIKRRVPPPLRGRKGIGPRGRASTSNTDADKSKFLQSPITKSPSPQSPSVSFVKSDARPSPSYTSTSEPKQKANTKGNKTKCPICSDLFHTDEIEAHASNCGLGMENSVTFDSVVGNGEKIKCNVCDKDLPLTTDYEAHVHECTRKARNK